jgi:hypothetical protein
MKLQKVIPAAAFAMTVLASTQAHSANNNGQPESALRTSPAVANAAVVNPFKKECAAVTKAKFAVMYLAGSGDCVLGADSFGPSKNLMAFSHPATGVYCFTPSKAAGLSGDKLLASYPTVEIEWGSSSGSELLAYVNRGEHNCPAGSIEVRTYSFSGGLNLSDSVAFYLKVN